MQHLRINQFHVQSDIPLPCDAACPSAPGGQLLRVRRDTTSPPLSPTGAGNLHEPNVRFARVAGGVRLDIEGRIAISVDDGGQEITVLARDKYLQEAALYVIGAAMALCTALRGDIPLHASSVVLGGHRIGFLAPCGTGKSTTLWEFLEAGALFANDDLIPVRLQGESAAATSCLSLWPKVGRDLMLRCPRDWSASPEILAGRGKFWFPIAPERRAPESGPLSALFALQPFEPGSQRDEVFVERVRGVQAVSHLAANSMTGTILPAILGSQRLMLNFGRLAAAVPVYAVRYPKRFEALPEVVDEVRQVLGELAGARELATAR